MFDFGEIKPSEILREGYRVEGLDRRVRPVYISGAEYRGEETEMFAYLGIPDKGREKYPVIILIHGGDGRAYERWVTEWTDRGFVALAIDNNGRHMTEEGVVDNSRGGPRAWEPWREELSDEKNTWAYVSCKTLLMAEGLLASIPCADMDRVYSHGISWGGYLSYIYLAHTRLIRLGAVSYTTADMHMIPEWQKGGLTPSAAGEERYGLWVDKYDAKNFIPSIRTPLILARGVEDKCFPPRTVNKTLELFREGILTFTNLRKYVHGQINGSSMHDINSRICEDAYGDVERAESYKYTLVYTKDGGEDSLDKEWVEIPITREEYLSGKRVDCAFWYYNEISPRGFIRSGRIYGIDGE